MMSKKCKYAIKALIRLGKDYKVTHVQTSVIAKDANIPKKFLEQILLDLKHAGIVASKQGIGGGYYLTKAPSKINLADVYRLFDGAIALVPCVAVKFYEKCDDCKNEKSCTLHREFSIIKEKTRQLMKKTTLQSFLN